MDTPDKGKERLNPLNDYLFLKVMGEKGDEAQLLSFLNAVLEKTGNQRFKSIEIVEHRSFSADIIGDKASILDVRGTLEDGTRSDVEVQLRNLGNMNKRSLFYWSQEFTQGLEAGQDYLKLPKVICVNIINFDWFPTEDFHSCFHLWEDRNRDLMLTDALEIHFIEMPKFRRLAEKDLKHNALHRWLTYFNQESSGEELAEVLRMDQGIQKAQERMDFVAQDKEAYRAYRLREMALSDWTSGVNYARQEGLKEGEQKGRQEGLREGEQKGRREGEQKGRQEQALATARKLKAMSLPLDQIIQATGLTEPQIREL